MIAIPLLCSHSSEAHASGRHTTHSTVNVPTEQRCHLQQKKPDKHLRNACTGQILINGTLEKPAVNTKRADFEENLQKMTV
jgi:hypothetical protein